GWGGGRRAGGRGVWATGGGWSRPARWTMWWETPLPCSSTCPTQLPPPRSCDEPAWEAWRGSPTAHYSWTWTAHRAPPSSLLWSEPGSRWTGWCRAGGWRTRSWRWSVGNPDRGRAREADGRASGGGRGGG